MAYPTYGQGLESTRTPLISILPERMNDGTFRARRVHASQHYRFVIVHPGLVTTDKDTLESYVLANIGVSETFTWQFDGSVYSAAIVDGPQITRIAPAHDGVPAKWRVVVVLETV